MSPSQIASRIGLVNLPTLAAPLAAAGFQISGGGPFREAALAIKAAAEAGIVSAIFVADRPEAGVKAWLTRMISHGSIVVIVREDLPRLDIDLARSVDLPATVGELVAVAGLAADPALSAIRIGVDGQAEFAGQPTAAPVPAVTPVPTAAPVPVRVSAFDDPAPEPAAQQVQPAAPESWTPAAAPASAFVDVQASPIAFAAARAAQAVPSAAAEATRRAASPWDEEPAPQAQPVPQAQTSVRPSPWDEPAAVAVAPAAVQHPIPAVRADEWFGDPIQATTSHQGRQDDSAALGAENTQVGVLVPETAVRAPQGPQSAGNGHPDAERYHQSPPEPQPSDSRSDSPPDQHPQSFRQQMRQQSAHAAASQPSTTSSTGQYPSAGASNAQPEAQHGAHQYAPSQAPGFRYSDAPDAAEDAVEVMLASAGTAVEQLTPIQTRRPRGQGAPMAIVCAEKGGVGKTNTSLALAQRAADLAPGKTVVLIDMNRGQGDIRKYLKLGGAQLPSILDAAISGNIGDAVLSAEQITAARHSQLPPISFGVVLAPEMEAADFRIVTADVYQRVIDLVRGQADFVVVDTQIIEIHDTSGLVDGLIVPALAHDAFGVALTDTSTPGVSNLVTMLKWFSTQGVPTNRLMIVINRALASYDTDVLRGMLGKYGTFTGAITEKAILAQQANMGRIPHNDPSLAPVLDAALLRMTGWPCFQPAPPDTKRGFFSRGKKSKK